MVGYKMTDIFTEKTKLNTDVGPHGTPLDVLKMFVGDGFINIIILETKRYMEKKADHDFFISILCLFHSF